MAKGETEASGSIPKKFPLTKAILNSLGKNKMQSLFLILLLLICPFLVLFLKEFDSIFQMRVKNNPSYDWPKYSDLLIALFTCCITIVLFEVITKILKTPCLALISEKYNDQERLERSERLVKSMFKGSYFAFASVFGYLIAKDSFFMPKNLGGIGNVEDTFKGLPYFDKTGLLYFKEYFMIQLGYHMSSFFLLFLSKPRNDFIEMLLHHSITVFLLSLAYLMNYWPISLMILYTHDISDTFVCFTRVFVDTKYKEIAFASYICLMISWVYTRLYIFPFDLLRVSCYENPMIHEVYGIGILGTMAHILVVLHVYWFYLLVVMGIRFIRTSNAVDIQHDLSSRNHQD